MLHIVDDLPVEDAGAPGDVPDFKSEFGLYQVAERVGTEGGVIIDLRNAGLVGPNAGELAGDDLAAKALARFEDLYLAGFAELVGEVSGCE
jgi:hypothetical protein